MEVEAEPCVEDATGAACAPTEEGEGTAAGRMSTFWPAWGADGFFSVFVGCDAALAASFVAGLVSVFGLAASAAREME